MGAPLGNDNASKGRQIERALKAAVAQDEGKRIRAGVEKLLDLFEQGDPFAVNFVTDRLDGRVPQAITGPDGDSIFAPLLLSSHLIKQKLQVVEKLEDKAA